MKCLYLAIMSLGPAGKGTRSDPTGSDRVIRWSTAGAVAGLGAIVEAR
jgi:hypothetical protein